MGITQKEALDCFASDDLIGIGMEADAVRRRLHSEGIVTYAIEGRLDYTSQTDPTAFDQQIAHLIDYGATTLILQGKPAPHHTIAWFGDLFRTLKRRTPDLWLHCLSASEILTISHQSNLPIDITISHLQEAGLDSIPGNDAGILDDAVQPNARKAADWIAAHRAAHKLGIQTTATMIFGAGETAEHRVQHLETLHQLQQETGGFSSFTPWPFTPERPGLDGFEEATAVEYLKTLAISRMYLDNIINVQSNLETQGLKVLQVGLRFGANDVSSALSVEGANSATEEQLRQIIRDAGFKPAQRDTVYRTLYLA